MIALDDNDNFDLMDLKKIRGYINKKILDDDISNY